MLEKRRFFYILLGISLFLCVLLGRLFWIQTIPTFSDRQINLTRGAVLQRQHGIELDSGRGHFYDRNLQPLTGTMIQALVLLPATDRDIAGEMFIRELSEITDMPKQQLESIVFNLKQPELWKRADGKNPIELTAEQVARIQALESPLARVMPYRIRYAEQPMARHLIGFISENPQMIREQFANQLHRGYLTLQTPIGGAGLEKSFERYLQGIGTTSVSFFTDANQRLLKGLDARIVRPNAMFYPLQIVTTLDIDIQRRIEALLTKSGFHQGAVVVLDAHNADIVAMAVRPQFDPYEIHVEEGNWSNRALKAIEPGSIFKTVVAAAALEHKVVAHDELFACDGELGKYGFSCWLKGGHGLLTFEQAYAESCNITFAQVMGRLNAEQLSVAAEQLGLGQQVGWSDRDFAYESGLQQLDYEEAGQIFASGASLHDEGLLIQTAIGQRDVRMTPLQAANMVVTILHKGNVLSPRAVREIRYANGGLLRTFAVKKADRQNETISNRTAVTLLDWMEEVVHAGTGTALQQAKWQVAGKSGTAQIGGDRMNQWFVGYGPTDKPRYAVAVVAEDRKDGSRNQAIAVFRGVMDILAEQRTF